MTAALIAGALLLSLATIAGNHGISSHPSDGIQSNPLLLCLVFFAVVLTNNNRDLLDGSGFLWICQFGGTLVVALALSRSTSHHWADVAVRAIALFGLLYAVATIIFWLFPSAYEAVYPFLRTRTAGVISGAGYRAGLTTHYSDNGMYIVLGFLACACYSIGEKGRFWRIAAALCLIGLVLTTKRAHLAFGIAAFSCSYFVMNSQRKLSSFGKFIAVTAVALLLLYILSFFNSDVLNVLSRFQAMMDGDSFGDRSDFYQICLNMWGENPILGLGWGSYAVAFNQSPISYEYRRLGYSDMDAHNVFLQLLAEEGLIGFALMVLVISASLVITLRALLRPGVSEVSSSEDFVYLHNRSILACSLSVQLFFAMYCMTGNPLYEAKMFVPWLVSIGISISLASFQEKIVEGRSSSVGFTPLLSRAGRLMSRKFS